MFVLLKVKLFYAEWHFTLDRRLPCAYLLWSIAKQIQNVKTTELYWPCSLTNIGDKIRVQLPALFRCLMYAYPHVRFSVFPTSGPLGFVATKLLVSFLKTSKLIKHILAVTDRNSILVPTVPTARTATAIEPWICFDAWIIPSDVRYRRSFFTDHGLPIAIKKNILKPRKIFLGSAQMTSAIYPFQGSKSVKGHGRIIVAFLSHFVATHVWE